VKILIDTDILLDVALRRSEFYAHSAAVLSWAEANPGQAAMAWHSLSNLAYMIKPDARTLIADLLDFVEVAPVSTSDMLVVVGLPMKNLEDAMQVAAALSFGARHLVTRNLPDHRRSAVPALAPQAFLALVE
jgi:predicted nucleic acid-binding protein